MKTKTNNKRNSNNNDKKVHTIRSPIDGDIMEREPGAYYPGTMSWDDGYRGKRYRRDEDGGH